MVRHEIGHVLNQILAPTLCLAYSNCDEFKAAYARDLEGLSEDDKKQLTYFLQKDDAGRDETFAAIFAFVAGGPSSEGINPLLERAFPEVQKLIRRKLGELE